MNKAMGIILGLSLAWSGALTSLVFAQRETMLKLMDIVSMHIAKTNAHADRQAEINEKTLTIMRQITVRQIGHDPIEWPNK